MHVNISISLRFKPLILEENIMFKTLSILAIASSLLIPIKAEAASCTSASFYGMGDGFHGRRTASGRTFNAYGNTVAHPWLPFGTRLRVTNQNNGRSVNVVVTDRGPYVASRGLDMSYGSFASIASPSRGVVSVCYHVIG